MKQLLASALLLMAGAAAATEPDSGRIDAAQRSVNFSGGPYFLVNPLSGLPGQCDVAALCDVFQLQTELSATEAAGKSLQFKLDWTGLANDFDVYLYAEDGRELAAASSFSKPELMTIPAEVGLRHYRLQIVPYRSAGAVVSGVIELLDPQAGDEGDGVSALPMRFALHASPDVLERLGENAGEPSLAVSQHAPSSLIQAGLETLRVDFDERTVPARSEWQDVSAPLSSVLTLDPVLEADPVTQRVFVSQLLGATSLTVFSDDWGQSWQPAQIAPPNGGVDHQGLGVGPYPANSPFALVSQLAGYGHAVYFCSQLIVTAFCSRSDDGGVTFGPGVPIFAPGDCAGFHGKPKVDAAGTVYIPIRECNGQQALLISRDAGLSWETRPIPGSTISPVDPFLALPSQSQQAPGLFYVSYVNNDGSLWLAVSQDGGRSFSRQTNLGKALGLPNSVFPVIAVGDPERVAVGFVGTTTAGDFQAADFAGSWHLYLASSQDGGRSWAGGNITPGDPVQGPGGICIQGLACGLAQNRNLLEFNDIGLDAQGRLHLVFADGCVGECVDGGRNTFAARVRLARQISGPRLFGAFDPVQPRAPAAVRLEAQRVHAEVDLRWHVTDERGAAVTAYRIYRGLAPDQLSLLAEIGPHLSYRDAPVDEDIERVYYRVTAVNAEGEGELAPVLAVPMSDPASLRSRCFVPGERVLIDPADDSTFLHPSLDLREVYLAEPRLTAQAPLREPVVISLRTTDLSQTLPGSVWRVDWLDSVGTRRFAQARISLAGEVLFEHGQGDTIQGSLGPGSVLDSQQNLIVLVLPREPLGLPAAAGVLQRTDVSTRINLTAAQSSNLGQFYSDSYAPQSGGQQVVDLELRSAAACQQRSASRTVAADPLTRGGSLQPLGLLLLCFSGSCFARRGARARPGSRSGPVPAARRVS